MAGWKKGQSNLTELRLAIKEYRPTESEFNGILLAVALFNRRSSGNEKYLIGYRFPIKVPLHFIVSSATSHKSTELKAAGEKNRGGIRTLLLFSEIPA